MRKLIASAAAAIIGSGFFVASTYAQGFAGHHRGGISAIRPCIAVMSASQKATLQQIFSTQKQTLRTDHQNVASAKKTLAAAILSGGKDVSSQESTLASAQQQLQKDQDATAAQVCSQLSATQLSAAQSLFNDLVTLHTNTRQQAQSYLQQAQAAAGNAQSQDETQLQTGGQND